MFKKPLSNLKTSAPLRSSDRRKLKQRVVQVFLLSSDDGDVLVPEGLLSVKFITHLDEPGVAYLSPDGEPLWFTLGKGSEDLIPTVYTLWKRPNLLPWLSTPPDVIPILVGGADLMIPGVVQRTTSHTLHVNQLVTVTQYERDKVGPALAVGWMVVDGDVINGKMAGDARRGKAVRVAHTWKDHLWELGTKGEPPDAVPVLSNEESEGRPGPAQPDVGGGEGDAIAEEPTELTLTSQETSSILRTSLLQAIHATLPAASFPISATIFYTSHILPGRPARPWETLPGHTPADPQTTTSPIDIKHSTHKSLTAFLKSLEKEHLVKLKDISGQLYITAVSPSSSLQPTENASSSHGAASLTPHTDVLTHRPYLSVGDVERKAKRAKERELEGGGDGDRRGKDMVAKELWKPHLQSAVFFEGAGRSPSSLYTLSEIKSVVNTYVTDKVLVNPNDQHYVNIDELLRGTLRSKANADEDLEYLKRDELVKRIVEKMQAWYELQSEGKEAVLKKGQLKPISIVIKIRQGRKASTLVTNFEPFFLTAEFLAEELRKICASATSVSPVQGGKSSGLEVLVQGKHIKAVTELLMSRSVPKKWIEVVDISDKKK